MEKFLKDNFTTLFLIMLLIIFIVSFPTTFETIYYAGKDFGTNIGKLLIKIFS